MLRKIVFMGTSNFAVHILKSLYQNGYPISAVYTQPPKKSNRGQQLTKSPINSFSENISLDVRTPLSLKNNKEEELYLTELQPDIILVISYGQIIPKNLLNIPKHGFLNVHASLLPKWRGAAPIQRSIMNLDSETGISIMKIAEKLDSGPVSKIYKVKLDRNQNTQEISEKLSNLAAEKILDIIDDVLEDKAKFIEQDHSKATYAKKINKEEGKIDWNEEPSKIIGKINGLFPSPGAYFNFNGERYKILKAEVGSGIGKVGEVISERLEIACNNNQSIKILEIQRQGKKVQKISEFILGSQIKKGSIIPNV